MIVWVTSPKEVADAKRRAELTRRQNNATAIREQWTAIGLFLIVLQVLGVWMYIVSQGGN